MITAVEARNFRSLQNIGVNLKPFQVLVGKNASGKSTFMDVIGFLADFVSDGLEKAVAVRSPNPRDLLHHRRGDRIDLAVEATVPLGIGERSDGLNTVRYYVAVRVGDETGDYGIAAESLVLGKSANYALQPTDRPSVPATTAPGAALVAEPADTAQCVVVERGADGIASFTREHDAGETGTKHAIKLAPGKSALGYLPADENSFPAATWLRDYLVSEIHSISFSDKALSHPSPPVGRDGILPDGSNLPRIVARFREESPERFRWWIDQLQTDLPDLVDISTFVRPEDGHSYLVFEYRGGAKVPAWLISTGSLRLAAYTLPAYLPHSSGTYLIERPEQHVHAGSMQTIYDALTSLYDSQVLIATQSTSLMAFLKPKDLLCFARGNDGATDIVWGSDHRYLKDWSGAIDVGSIVASGILG